MAPYQYLPLNEDLDEIRTLTLHPGDFSADIHISIQKVVLTTDNPPIYEALSYAWGSTEDPVDIRIGSSGNETLAVTQNLAVALPYLRYEDKVRTLWIDAICINQQDLGERSRQVKRMADIFGLADRVVVWLGPEKDNSARVLHLLWDLSADMIISAFNWTDFYTFIPCSIDDTRSIDALISRPWFSRLWVWQEIGLARNNPIVVCGTDTIPWASFRRAIFCLEHKAWDPDYVGLQQRLRQLEEISRFGGGGSLGSMIRRTAVCQCSDPRDHVYAVQSLLPRSDTRLKIEPDYTKVTAQVYQDLMILYVNSGRLDMLRYCELKNDVPMEMPSWVPNWADKDTAKHFGDLARASGHSEAVARYQGDGVLSAAGVIFATVSGVQKMIFQHTYKGIINLIQRLNLQKTEHLSYVAGGSLIDAVCRTLIQNIFCNEYHPPKTYYARFEESRDFVLALSLDKNPKFNSDASIDSKKFLESVRTYCSKRSFIITEEGYIGIAPRATKPGDRVCVLLGCRTPLLLRKTSGLQSQVVGECYIHGVMDGEAFLGPLLATVGLGVSEFAYRIFVSVLFRTWIR
ncbi:heterokaryon incompatibility protein-domain-containing protein [Usnea florida]